MAENTLIGRLKLCANLIDVHGCDSSAIFEAITALSSPPSIDIRAWAQHKETCDSVQTKELWLPCSCGLDSALSGGQP